MSDNEKRLPPKKKAHLPTSKSTSPSTQPIKPVAQPADTLPLLKGNGALKTAGHIIVQHGFVPDKKGAIQSETRKAAFLDYYNDFMTPAHTCQALNISMRTWHTWLKDDQRFYASFMVVDQHLTDRLVRKGYIRAFNGSDNLLMFMLKSKDPKYRDKVSAELDPKVTARIVNTLVDALRKEIPNTCPHCKSNLALDKKVESMLSTLSKGIKADGVKPE